MLRSIKSSQRKLRLLCLRLEGSSGVVTVEGPDRDQVTVEKIDNGDYLVTFNQAFSAAPIAVGNVEAIDKVATIIPTTTTVSVKINDVDTSASLSNGDVQLIVIGSDVTQNY